MLRFSKDKGRYQITIIVDIHTYKTQIREIIMEVKLMGVGFMRAEYRMPTNKIIILTININKMGVTTAQSLKPNIRTTQEIYQLCLLCKIHKNRNKRTTKL